MKIECIKGTCQNQCKVTNECHKQYDWGKRIKYYKFEKIPAYYFDRQGEKKVYFRTGRKDYKVSLLDAYETLLSQAREYLEHRYNVTCNKIYWEGASN